MTHNTPSRGLGAPTIVGAAVAVLLSLPGIGQAQSDPVVLTFSTIGDSRQDPKSSKWDPSALPTAQDKIWLQATRPFARIIRTIQTQKPQLLFFNGDMIMGYGRAALPAALPATADAYMKTDLAQFYTQYAYWRGMVTPLQETGTYVVPVPGNHEVQCNSANVASGVCLTTNGGKNAYVENENVWRANMGDLILDTGRLNAVLPSGLTVQHADVGDHTTLDASGNTVRYDGLTTSQAQLSYSFDVGDNHFVVINTDPTGADGTSPNAWLAADLSKAKNTNGAKHFFVFGHKPAYTYDFIGNGGALSGMDAADTTKRDVFWGLIEQYKATYFCGHEHTFNMRQPLASGSSYQVLVGSGGSPFDVKQAATAPTPATDRYYAWATVKVYQSGKVQIDAWGFNGDTATYGPTQLIQSVTLPAPALP